MKHRIIDLMNQYGEAKFKDEWWPGNASPHIGKKKGKELGVLLDSDVGDIHRTVALMNEYGQAKFGDEWWPGNAECWIGGEDGAELEERLETTGFEFNGATPTLLEPASNA